MRHAISAGWSIVLILVLAPLAGVVCAWEVQPVAVPGGIVELVDLAVFDTGVWAGCPWILCRVDGANRLVRIDSPGMPEIEPIPFSAEKILFDAGGNPVLLELPGDGGMVLHRRLPDAGWEVVFIYPEYQSIWMDPDFSRYIFAEAEQTEYIEDFYYQAWTETLFAKVIDASTFEVQESFAVADLVSSSSSFGGECSSDSLHFEQASPGLYMERKTYSTWYHFDSWVEYVNLPQIPHTTVRSDEEEKPPDLEFMMNERPGCGWVAHWRDDGGYWTVTPGGEYLLSAHPVQDLRRSSADSAAIVYSAQMLTYQAMSGHRWELPEVVAPVPADDARICVSGDTTWIAFTASEGLNIASSAAGRTASSGIIPPVTRSADDPTGPVTPTPTPRPPTATPGPTYTPRFTVTPSPTPDAPVLCTESGVTLESSITRCRPGDVFTLAVSICNASSTDWEQVPFFCLLEAGGSYFYYPAWTDTVNWMEIPVVRAGMTRHVVFEPFFWPEGLEPGGPVRFISAVTDPDVTYILGSMDELAIYWEE